MTNIVYIRLLPDDTKDYIYAVCSVTAWKNWCIKNGVRFVLFDSRHEGNLQDVLAYRYGKDIRVLAVDDNTLVKWDAPVDVVFSSPKLTEIPAGTPIDAVVKMMRTSVITRFALLAMIPLVWEKVSHLYL